MRAKRKPKRTKIYPLSYLIREDRKNKQALKAQFIDFHDRMAKAMKEHPELKHLEVHLKKTRDCVVEATFGKLGVRVCLEVEEDN